MGDDEAAIRTKVQSATRSRRPAADRARTTRAVRSDILRQSSRESQPNRCSGLEVAIRCDTRGSGLARPSATWEAAAESTCSWPAALSVLEEAPPGST